MVLLRILWGRALRWSARHAWPLAIGVVLIVVDVLNLPPLSARLFLAAGLLSIGYGVFELGRTVYEDWRALDRIYERPRPGGALTGPYESPYDTWEEISFGRWSAVTNARINARLKSRAEIPVVRDRATWKPAGKYEELRKLLRVRLDADEHKIRVSRDFLPNSSTISLQRTVYSAFLVTNRLCAYEIRERGDRREMLDADEVVLRAGRLPGLDRSNCSNHIGVDVLAISSRGRILLTRQSAANQVSRGLLASSGSGSADWRDLREQDDLVTVLARAMRREMCEELGLRPGEAPELSSILPLGYARLSHLGGKPQFFGVAKVDVATTRVRGIERRYIDDHLDISFDPGRGVRGVLEAIDSFESAYAAEMSFPLHVNLRMVRSWLAGDDRAGSWLGIGN